MSHTTVERQAAEFGHVAHVPVHFDDLDAMGLLHNARYAVLLERALTPYWAERGVVFRGDVHAAPDVFHAVREFTITYQAPVTGVGTVAVHFWLEHFGTSSAQYAFEFRSVDGATVHATGHPVDRPAGPGHAAPDRLDRGRPRDRRDAAAPRAGERLSQELVSGRTRAAAPRSRVPARRRTPRGGA